MLDPDMTIDEFYDEARDRRAAHPEWRYGQALFNTLVDVRPDLSEQVRGTENDPFYAKGGIGDSRLLRFGAFINDHWGDDEHVEG